MTNGLRTVLIIAIINISNNKGAPSVYMQLMKYSHLLR